MFPQTLRYFFLVFSMVYFRIELIFAQGVCGRYTCEQNKDFSSTYILKCTSDVPRVTGSRASNYDCSTDIQFIDLKLGVTVCSPTAPSYSMNILPDGTATRELQRLTRYMQISIPRTSSANARCYFRNILPPNTTPVPPRSSTAGSTTAQGSMTYHVTRGVLIGSIIGAFFGGVLITAIIFVCIYFCCIHKRKEEKTRFVTPRINDAYRRDTNDNLDSSPTDLREKSWSREHRGRMDRLNGVIGGFTLEDVVTPYGTSRNYTDTAGEIDLETDNPVPPAPPIRPSPEEITEMYSKIDKTKKRRAPNGNAAGTGVSTDNPTDQTSPREIYIKGRSPRPNPDTSESVASSAEIVQPANNIHLYHILEKSES